MSNSHKCISLIYVRYFSLGKLPLMISVHLKISALFVVSDFFSAEVSPEIMEVNINPGFRTQKICPFPLNEVSPPFNQGHPTTTFGRISVRKTI